MDKVCKSSVMHQAPLGEQFAGWQEQAYHIAQQNTREQKALSPSLSHLPSGPSCVPSEEKSLYSSVLFPSYVSESECVFRTVALW